MTTTNPDQIDEKKDYGPYSAKTGLSGSTTADYDVEAASHPSDSKNCGLSRQTAQLTRNLERPWLRRVTSSFKPDPKIPDIEEIKTRTRRRQNSLVND
jgi:hypothetical protein